MCRRALALPLAGIVLLSVLGWAQGLRGKVGLSGKTVIQLTGHAVTLSWSASNQASSYNIYRGNGHGGPYSRIASGVNTTLYVDATVTCGQHLYYVVTAVSEMGESNYSNEAAVTVP